MSQVNELDRLPAWVRLILALSAAGSVWLAARLVWEQTILSWRSGPQMVGFTLSHAETGLFLFLTLSTLLFAIALAVATVRSLIALWQKRRVSPLRWLGIAMGISILAMLWIPYSTWQRLFVSKLAAGPYAAEFFTYGAAVGDLGEVKAFLEHGIDVNVRNHDGSTALHAAAVEGQLHVINYLISRGASVNIRNKFGHTALDNAREMHLTAVVDYLESHTRH